MKKDNRWVLAPLVLALVGMGAIVGMISTQNINATPMRQPQKMEGGKIAQSPVAPVDDDLIRIPLAKLTGQVQKFELVDGEKTIKYMAVLGSDGSPRTAFDACEICGGSMGYEQKGTDVECKKCGRFFSIDSLGTDNLGGGCWPAHVRHIIEGDQVVIEQGDILKGGRYF